MARTPAPGAQATRHGQRGGNRTVFCARSIWPSSIDAFKFRQPRAGNAFVACRRRDLDLIFSLQFERTVNRDNTVSFENMTLQIEKVNWRGTLAGCHGPRSINTSTERAEHYTDRNGWVVTPARENPSRKLPRRWQLLKRRSVEKSKSRLSHRAWKSRKVRGIPTFQQLRRGAYKPKPDISY